MAYRADAPDRLLISGQWQQGEELFTLQYDLATGEQQTVLCDGEPAYKCAILGDQILYTHRTGGHFEDRQVRAAAKPDQPPKPPSAPDKPTGQKDDYYKRQGIDNTPAKSDEIPKNPFEARDEIKKTLDDLK